MPQIRVHIGPPKNASTSIQQALSDRRRALLDRGVLYPDPVWSCFHHEEICDFINLAKAAPPPLNANLTGYVNRSRPKRRRGSWRRLLASMRDHDGPSILSAEILAFLSEDLACELVASLPSDDVVVVLVSRRASSMLPSWYQEMGKRETVGQFDDFVARIIRSLVSGKPSLADILNHRELVRRWQATGAAVRVIEAPEGLSRATVLQALDVIAPEGAELWGDERRRANPGMSALGAHVLSRHYAECPPRYAGAALSVGRRMRSHYAQTEDPNLGGALTLQPAFAEVMDRYCAVNCDERPTAEDVREAARSGMVEPVDWEDFDIEAVLATLRRWQRREDLKWATMSAVSRAVGRGRLEPAVFTSQ